MSRERRVIAVKTKNLRSRKAAGAVVISSHRSERKV
jgi:hypothetical protein